MPLIGSPITHMGHAQDLGFHLSAAHGATRYVGLSTSAGKGLSVEERLTLIQQQWAHLGSSIQFLPVRNTADLFIKICDQISFGNRNLTIVVGRDRRKFAERIRLGLESGKLFEDSANAFNQISIKVPATERTHGLSGTAMRRAAVQGDLETFRVHLGPMFSKRVAAKLMERVADLIKTNQMDLERK